MSWPNHVGSVQLEKQRYVKSALRVGYTHIYVNFVTSLFPFTETRGEEALRSGGLLILEYGRACSLPRWTGLSLGHERFMTCSAKSSTTKTSLSLLHGIFQISTPVKRAVWPPTVIHWLLYSVLLCSASSGTIIRELCKASAVHVRGATVFGP